MIAAIDNTFLTLLLNPKAAPALNPSTKRPVEHCRQKIEALIDELSKSGGTLLIPAPALAEALCVSASIEAHFGQLQQYAAIEVAPFDSMAAYELGRVIRDAKSNGDKRDGQAGNWQHVKMDRAIVAIARSAKIFYSDDDRQIAFAKMAGLAVKSTWELSLPPEYAQKHLSETSEAPWPTQTKPPKSNGSEKPPAG